MNLNIDLAIVAGYMFFCLVIGLFRYGKIKNIRDYTLGTKPFSTIVLLATTFATAIGSGHMIGHTSKVYELGLVYMCSFIFIPISWLILAKLLVPNLEIFREHKFISLSDIMEYWYGKIGRWVANIISILLSIAVSAMSAMAVGYLLHYFLGISQDIGMVVGLIIVTCYSVFGGITSVAFTDMFQFLVFFITLPIACAIGYQSTGGIKEILYSLPKSHIHIDHIPLFFGFIFYAALPCFDIAMIQRALIAKSRNQFLSSFIGVAVLLIPMLIIVCLIGLITYYHNPNIESNKVLYYFIDHYLPTGIKGLVMAGLLAAIMSTQDSYLNSVSALISHDICKQIWSSLTKKQELFIARISCIGIAIASLSLIFAGKGIMDILWLSGNFFEPLIVVPLIAGLLGIRINKRSFIFVVVSSIIAITAIRCITGEFDTRSLAVGMLVSAITLYILHKKKKKESIFSMPKIDINLVFKKLNKQVVNQSYSISSLYTVGIVLCMNFLVGIAFVDLSSFNLINITIVVTGCLFLILLLNELWDHRLRRYISDVWRLTLIFGLIFIPSYILFANEFHILWVFNFLLSAILYIMMSDIVIGLPFILIVGSIGYLLPNIFIYKVDLIDETFAYISCGAIIAAIILQFHKKHSITKAAHEEITRELKVVIRERVQESLGVKEEFLNKLNHELRIPLSVMINTSDGIYEMWDRLSDKDKKKYLKDIVDSRKRYEAYTSNILDLASLKQKKFQLNIKPDVDLIKLSRAAIDDAQSLIVRDNKNLKIKLELSKNTKSAVIACDEKRINQVLENLLSNAIKYSDKGIIKLSIDTTKDNVKIAISDPGVGIPNDEKPKIFEPFFEGSRTKSPAEGKGLGLSVAQQIAILHEGYIKIEDNKPHGSIFTFSLSRKIIPNSNDNITVQHCSLAA